MEKGFKFDIMDVEYVDADRVVEINVLKNCMIWPHCCATRNGLW